MNTKMSSRERQGFALITAISVLFLLTLVPIALLSLSALTVKTSRFDWAREEARANARLGLMIAIGELQRDLGPDQRIALSASILDENSDTLRIDGVANQHWTGVVSSVFEGNKSGSPFTRDMNAGGLQDARSGGGIRVEDQIFNYFVSGNEGGRRKMRGFRHYQDARDDVVPDGVEGLDIVAGGSVIDPDDYVRVKKMATEKEQVIPDGGSEFRPNGAYAYWVCSNSTKANVVRLDPHRAVAIDHETGRGMQRMLHPQDAESSRGKKTGTFAC